MTVLELTECRKPIYYDEWRFIKKWMTSFVFNTYIPKVELAKKFLSVRCFIAEILLSSWKIFWEGLLHNKSCSNNCSESILGLLKQCCDTAETQLSYLASYCWVILESAPEVKYCIEEIIFIFKCLARAFPRLRKLWNIWFVFSW